MSKWTVCRVASWGAVSGVQVAGKIGAAKILGNLADTLLTQHLPPSVGVELFSDIILRISQEFKFNKTRENEIKRVNNEPVFSEDDEDSDAGDVVMKQEQQVSEKTRDTVDQRAEEKDDVKHLPSEEWCNWLPVKNLFSLFFSLSAHIYLYLYIISNLTLYTPISCPHSVAPLSFHMLFHSWTDLCLI